MKQSTLLKVASQSILKNKMRTLLTMLGIVIGVGAVIVMVAVGNGAQTQIESQINSLGTNLIIVMPGAGNAGGVNQGAGTFNRLTVEDADKLKREAHVARRRVAGRVDADAGHRAVGQLAHDASTACRPTILTIRNWTTRSGAFFTDDDVRSGAQGRRARRHGRERICFPDSDPVGAQIQIGNVPFTVVGVLAREGPERRRAGSGRRRCSCRTRRRRRV